MLLGCCYHKTEHAQWNPISKKMTSLLQSHTSHPDMPTTPEDDLVSSSSGCGWIGGMSGCGNECGQDGEMSGRGTISKYGLRLAAQETKER